MLRPSARRPAWGGSAPPVDAGLTPPRSRPGFIRREQEPQVAELANEIREVLDTAADVLGRVERVRDTVACRGLRHKLHQAVSTLGRTCTWIPTGLHIDDRLDEPRVNTVPDCRLLNELRKRE